MKMSDVNYEVWLYSFLKKLFNKIIEALDSEEQMHILCKQHYVKN